jgi:hypothetical protein
MFGSQFLLFLQIYSFSRVAALANVITSFVLLDTQVGCKVCAVYQVCLAKELVLTLSQSQAL